MNPITGSTLLLAGTAIGAGMIALPMTLSKVGLLPGMIALLVIWASVYYSALTTADLNFRAGQPSSINSLARLFQGRKAEWICKICMLLLTYSLMVAYLSGGSSIIESLLQSAADNNITSQVPAYDTILITFTIFLFTILISKTKLIDSINRVLFFGLLASLAIVIIGIGTHLHLDNLPWIGEKVGEPSSWFLLLPVVFTSFGFQLTIPSIIEYLGIAPQDVRKSLFWGSLIPVIVYCIWSLFTLGIIYQSAPLHYQQLAQDGKEVGHFIDVISHVTQWSGLRVMSWIISILALVTSAIGVGLGIKSFWGEKLSTMGRFRNPLIGLLVVILPYLISHIMKDAFLQALAFAGMILVTLSILIPVYFLFTSDRLFHKASYTILNNIPLRIIVFLFGLSIFVCEIINLS